MNPGIFSSKVTVVTLWRYKGDRMFGVTTASCRLWEILKLGIEKRYDPLQDWIKLQRSPHMRVPEREGV
jgi:hypothetical protein